MKALAAFLVGFAAGIVAELAWSLWLGLHMGGTVPSPELRPPPERTFRPGDHRQWKRGLGNPEPVDEPGGGWES